MEQLSDSNLVKLSIDGDESAFATLVLRHAGAMRAYARYLVGSDTDADEAVQEAFIVAWTDLDKLRDPQAIRAWLMRITARKAIDQVRSRRPVETLEAAGEVASDAPGPQGIAEQRDQLDRLHTVLNSLPSSQRQAWILREVGQMSYEEIARYCHTSSATIRGRLARARETITQEMEEWR